MMDEALISIGRMTEASLDRGQGVFDPRLRMLVATPMRDWLDRNGRERLVTTCILLQPQLSKRSELLEESNLESLDILNCAFTSCARARAKHNGAVLC